MKTEVQNKIKEVSEELGLNPLGEDLIIKLCNMVYLSGRKDQLEEMANIEA